MVCAVAALVVWGCGAGAKLVQDRPGGGVVVYPFTESGHMVSPFRKEAFEIMRERCGGNFRIVKEGETRSRQRVSGIQGAEEIVRERRWGIEFQCKAAERSDASPG